MKTVDSLGPTPNTVRADDGRAAKIPDGWILDLSGDRHGLLENAALPNVGR